MLFTAPFEKKHSYVLSEYFQGYLYQPHDLNGFLRAHLRPSYGEKQNGVLRMCTIPVILLWST